MSDNTYLANLEQKVARRELKVAVVGLGYVGLPLAVRFAEIGFKVIGVDLDEKKVDSITDYGCNCCIRSVVFYVVINFN